MFHKLINWLNPYFKTALLLSAGSLILLTVGFALFFQGRMILSLSNPFGSSSNNHSFYNKDGKNFLSIERVRESSKLVLNKSDKHERNSTGPIVYGEGIHVVTNLQEDSSLSLWSSNLSGEDLFFNEKYINAKADLDIETQLLGWPMKLDQDKLSSLKVGDEITLQIPQLDQAYEGFVVEVSSNNGISSIHGDLLGEEVDLSIEEDDFSEVFVLTIGKDGSGSGVMFTNDGTYDIQVNKGYVWITNNNHRVKGDEDNAANITKEIHKNLAEEIGGQLSSAIAEGLQSLAKSIEKVKNSGDLEKAKEEFNNSPFNMTVAEIKATGWPPSIQTYLLDNRNLISWRKALDYLSNEGLFVPE